MKEHKSYMDIIRYGKKETQEVLNVGDYITISEKVDGSNASWSFDLDSPISVSCFSRNKTLDFKNNLNGFYQWVETKIQPQCDKLNPNWRYYGEWLKKHKVSYLPEYYNNFYLFNIYDETTHQYLSDDLVESEAQKLGIETVEYFYKGEFIDFDHLMSFVGKSNKTLTPNTGEGIVVKNVNYRDKFGRQMFVKLVSEAFAEIQSQKLPKNPKADEAVMELVKSVVTNNRVEKIIHKCVDDQELDEDYSIESMGKIIKIVSGKVYADCMKEESEIFEGIESQEIGKLFSKVIPSVIKNVLKEQGRA